MLVPINCPNARANILLIMETHIPSRQEAFELLCKYNSNESLIKHALAVEAVMRYMARKHGEDEEMWGAVGLVHDLDYERYPEEHCRKTPEFLREAGWPDDYIRAVVSHGWGISTVLVLTPNSSRPSPGENFTS